MILIERFLVHYVSAYFCALLFMRRFVQSLIWIYPSANANLESLAPTCGPLRISGARKTSVPQSVQVGFRSNGSSSPKRSVQPLCGSPCGQNSYCVVDMKTAAATNQV